MVIFPINTHICVLVTAVDVGSIAKNAGGVILSSIAKPLGDKVVSSVTSYGIKKLSDMVIQKKGLLETIQSYL